MFDGKMDKLLDVATDSLFKFFKDRVDDVGTEVTEENPARESFEMTFSLYKFTFLKFEYLVGMLKIGILYGENGETIWILSDQFDVENLDMVWQKLDEEIRLRIPDKYLKKYGWL